jgi:NADPH:quinone reductase-like Zn-dependent oxidoreductase
LIGTATLLDSLQCARQKGIVCMTGIVGNRWSLDGFSPMDAIPTSVCLTSYSGEAEDFMRTPLDEMVEAIAAGTMSVKIGKVFRIDDIVEAHRVMEESNAGGKIVVLT